MDSRSHWHCAECGVVVLVGTEGGDATDDTCPTCRKKAEKPKPLGLIAQLWKHARWHKEESGAWRIDMVDAANEAAKTKEEMLKRIDKAAFYKSANYRIVDFVAARDIINELMGGKP